MSNNELYTTLNITVEGDRVAAQLKQAEVEDSNFSPLSLSSDKLDLKVLDLCRRLIDEDQLHSKQDFQLIGRLLHKILFTDKVKENFDLVRGTANPDAEHRLRVELEFKGIDTLGLSKLPWEYLVYQDKKTHNWEFVSTVAVLVLTRYLEPKQSGHQAVVELDEKTINVLLVFSNPQGKLPDLEPTWKAVKSQLNTFKAKLSEHNITVNVDEIEQPMTWDSFQTRINRPECRPHILHLIAHGRFEGSKKARSGEIAFLSRADTDVPIVEWQSDSNFVNVFANANKLPRFVFLHMCEGGAFDKQSDESSAGVALRLAEEGVPAVVAMQHNIKIETATEFSEVFYDVLGEGNTLDEAVQLGRSAIAQTYENDRAFGTPVLFLSTSSTLLPKIERLNGRYQRQAPLSEIIITIDHYNSYLWPEIQTAMDEKGLTQEMAVELDHLFTQLLKKSSSQWLDAIREKFGSYSPIGEEKKGRDLCAVLEKKIEKLTESS